MPTVIDSLFVSLGLDTKDFTKGTKEASASFKKTKEEATRTGKDIESSSKSAVEGLNKLALAALSMFAVFSGARSIKDFVTQIGLADSALGRLAANLNSTPEQLSAIANAVERNGGSAQTAASSMRSLSDSFTELKNTGNTGILPMLQQLQGKSGVPIDIMHGFEKALPGISEALRVLKAKSPADANWFGRQIGIDEETVTFLSQGWRKVSAEMERSKKIGGVTKESAEQAQKLLESWRELEQAARDLGRQLFVGLAPAFNDILQKLTAWIEANKGWLNQKITAAVEEFGRVVKNVANSPEMHQFVSWMSSRETWAPFLDFIKQAGSEENWKGLKTVVGWLRQQFKEIHDLFKTIDILTSQGFRDGVPWSKLWSDWDKNHTGFFGRDERAEKGLPPITSDGGGERPIAGGGGLGLRRAHRQPDHEEMHGGHRGRAGGGGGHISGPNGVTYQATSLKTAMGITQEQYDAFREGLTDIEGKRYDRMGGSGGRFAGRYQMGPQEITQTAIRLGVPRPSTAQFLSDPQMQERFFENYTKDHYDTLMRHPRFAAMSARDKLKILGYAHNQGAGGPTRNNGAWGYLSSGKIGGDAWGTPGTAYFKPIERRLDAAERAHTSNVLRPIPQARNFATGVGAASSAAASVSHDNRVSHHSTSETKVGHIHVTVPNGDAHTIAKSIGPAIERHSYATHANYGMA